MNTIDLERLCERGSPAQKLWALVLLLAIKDGATRVWYDPARGDFRLGYEIGGVSYAVVPPPESLEALLANTMADLLHRRSGRNLLGRLLGGPSGPSAPAEDWFVAGVGGHGVAMAATLDLPRSRVILRIPLPAEVEAAAFAALDHFMKTDGPTLRGFPE